MFKFIFSLVFLFHLSVGYANPEKNYGNQNSSLTDWKNLNPIQWLDYHEWRADLISKEENPLWESILRERNNIEVMGRILDCVGNCLIYQEKGFFKVSYRSQVFEGDEIHTLHDSYAWIFLVDGTLLRLAPDSSITLKEINIAKDANFIHARINYGLVTWLSRKESLLKESTLRDTDSIFLPLKMYEANVQAYLEHTNQNDENQNLYDFIAEKPIWENHYKRLNQHIKQNNDSIENIKKTLNFIVLPNGTFYGKALSGDFLVLNGGMSYANFRSDKTLRLQNEPQNKLEEKNDITFFFRGFTNTQTYTPHLDTWYKIDEEGKNISEYNEPSLFRISSFLTERISSIYLAREILLSETKNYILNPNIDPIKLARNHGYRIWNITRRHETKNEFELRLDFLKEYTRRIETNNLLNAKKFKIKMKDRGEDIEAQEYSDKYFSLALEKYYKKGKKSEVHNTDREKLNSTEKPLWNRINAKRPE